MILFACSICFKVKSRSFANYSTFRVIPNDKFWQIHFLYGGTAFAWKILRSMPSIGRTYSVHWYILFIIIEENQTRASILLLEVRTFEKARDIYMNYAPEMGVQEDIIFVNFVFTQVFFIIHSLSALVHIMFSVRVYKFRTSTFCTNSVFWECYAPPTNNVNKYLKTYQFKIFANIGFYWP